MTVDYRFPGTMQKAIWVAFLFRWREFDFAWGWMRNLPWNISHFKSWLETFWQQNCFRFSNTNHYSVFFFARVYTLVHVLIAVWLKVLLWWIAFVFTQLMDRPSSIQSNEKSLFSQRETAKVFFCIFTWQLFYLRLWVYLANSKRHPVYSCRKQYTFESNLFRVPSLWSIYRKFCLLNFSICHCWPRRCLKPPKKWLHKQWTTIHVSLF